MQKMKRVPEIKSYKKVAARQSFWFPTLLSLFSNLIELSIQFTKHIASSIYTT